MLNKTIQRHDVKRCSNTLKMCPKLISVLIPMCYVFSHTVAKPSTFIKLLTTPERTILNVHTLKLIRCEKCSAKPLLSSRIDGPQYIRIYYKFVILIGGRSLSSNVCIFTPLAENIFLKIPIHR